MKELWKSRQDLEDQEHFQQRQCKHCMPAEELQEGVADTAVVEVMAQHMGKGTMVHYLDYLKIFYKS